MHIDSLILTGKRRILPGFGLTLGFTLLYLSLLVLIPVSATFAKASGLGWVAFAQAVTAPRVLASFRLSLVTALYAAAINAVMGVTVAWVLVRYRFPGGRILDAIVDLPFALPTAVAGIALTALYSVNGWLGYPIFAVTGMKVAYTQLGILVALIFVGLPFVVRTVNRFWKTLTWSTRKPRQAWCLALADDPPRGVAGADATGPDRICLGFRPRCRRIRFSGLHCRQHANEDRDRSPPDHHQARTIRLPWRNCHRRSHVNSLVLASALNQCPATLVNFQPHQAIAPS